MGAKNNEKKKFIKSVSGAPRAPDLETLKATSAPCSCYNCSSRTGSTKLTVQFDLRCLLCLSVTLGFQLQAVAGTIPVPQYSSAVQTQAFAELFCRVNISLPEIVTGQFIPSLNGALNSQIHFRLSNFISILEENLIF